MSTTESASKKASTPSQETHTSNGSSAKAPSAHIDAEDDDGIPIDRGYAWVIVFACMACNMLCLGLQRAYGILFVEFLVLFRMPVGLTTLVMAIQSGFTSVAALLTQTVVLSFLSERQTMMIGGLCGGLGLTLSYFATSLYFLIFTQSLLVGSSSLVIDSFHDALTSLGHPSSLISTHPTTFRRGTSRTGYTATIPRPWQLCRKTSEGTSRAYQLPADMIGRAMDNFNVRVAAVLRRRGAWIEHIINY